MSRDAKTNSIDEDDQKLFVEFTQKVKENIAALGIDLKSKNLLEIQTVQMNRLFDLEHEFKAQLLKTKQGKQVFEMFIKKIMTPKSQGGYGNVLSARPFCRENTEVCSGPMCKAIMNNNAPALYKYHYNAKFVNFALEAQKWSENNKLRKIAVELHKIRKDIISTNMPLALSRTRKFWSATFGKDPNRNVSYLDAVQMGIMGLCVAVDKMRPPMSVSFRNCIINRISSIFIEQYSATTLHFISRDRRKIYRAHKFLKFLTDKSEIDYEEMADYVNLDLEPGQRTTADEIVQLLAAANIKFSDNSTGTNKENDNPKAEIESQEADAECFNPEARYEDLESQRVLYKSIQQLSFFDQKILKLRGITNVG